MAKHTNCLSVFGHFVGLSLKGLNLADNHLFMSTYAKLFEKNEPMSKISFQQAKPSSESIIKTLQQREKSVENE